MRTATPPILSPAAEAFDVIADQFDERYGSWLSVQAQRAAVRAALLRAFPPGERILEIGGGTGEDAEWLAARGRRVLLTDPSPRMVDVARRKLAGRPGCTAMVAAAEALHHLGREGAFGGAFSNFAALNCVEDLRTVADGLRQLLRPGAPLLLVLFGPLPPAEIMVQLARGTPRTGLRRLSKAPAAAWLGGRHFTVRYHRPRDIEAAFRPGFRLLRRLGIGVFVPPSASEPWISERPQLLALLRALDRFASRPLALLGDHVLYWFERTDAKWPREGVQ